MDRNLREPLILSQNIGFNYKNINVFAIYEWIEAYLQFLCGSGVIQKCCREGLTLTSKF